MLSMIDTTNRKWIESGKKVDPKEIFIGSLDAAALYPSLKTRKCAKLVGEYIRKNKLQFEGVNMKWATLYIALNSEPWKINSWRMGKIIPQRRFTNGPRPCMKGADDPMCEYRCKWPTHPDKLTPEEQRLVMSKV